MLLMTQNAFGQFEDSDRKVQFRTNVMADGLLNFNLGLRFQSKHRWKPDFAFSFHLPITTVLPLERVRLFGSPLLLGGMGKGFSVYGGCSSTETRGSGKWRIRSSFLLGLKAWQSGVYYWGYYGSYSAPCGRKDEQRVTMGPSAMASFERPLGDRMGIEFSSGCGTRVGVHRVKVQSDGTYEYDCRDYDYLEGRPETEFGNWRFSLVPAIHAGIALAFW